MGNDNINLHKAKRVKNDEFFTYYKDVEAEVLKYKPYFKGKKVYCPCDNSNSAFVHFFLDYFDKLELEEVVATYQTKYDISTMIYIHNGIVNSAPLEGNGDFHSPECIELFKACDIVCTNPPFSQFRDFVNILHTYNKQFLIIGNQNAFTYKEIFKLIKSNQLWTGYNKVKSFLQPDGTEKKFGNICWFTNLPNTKREEKLALTKKYSSENYPKYDNYDAIEVGRVANIPIDYRGVMGVPITFIDKYNPNQFEIVGDSRYHDGSDQANDINFINGKELYKRVLIKWKID